MDHLPPALETALLHSRRRWWLGRVLRAAVWGWLLCAILATFQLLATRLGYLASIDLWIPVGAGIAVALGWLFWSGRQAPSLQQLAQQADLVFGLHEQLSTAREYRAERVALPLHQQVWQLQRAQAAQLVQRLDPRALVPMRWPVVWRWALLFSILAGVVSAWPGQNPRVPTPAATSPTPQNQAVVQQLEALEEVVRQDAERRNDPVLQTTAQALRQLRQEVDQNQLSPEQLGRQVELVTQRVQQNYGLTPTAPTPNPPPGSSTAPPTATANSSQEVAPAQTAEPEAAVTPSGQPQAQAAQKIEETINRLQQKAQGSSAKPNNPGKTPPPQKAQSSCGENCQQEQPTDQYSAGAKQEAERRALEAAKRPPGGDPGGYGNEAGQGSPSQTAGASKPLPPKPSTTTVKVSSRPANTGSRIKIAAPPSTLPVSVSPQAAVGEVVFTQQPEEPMPVEPVEPQSRLVVARYFAPSEEKP